MQVYFVRPERELFKGNIPLFLLLEDFGDEALGKGAFASIFDVEITDDSVIYGYDENTANFNRGFWINTEIDDEEPEISLSELLSEENNQNNKELSALRTAFCFGY